MKIVALTEIRERRQHDADGNVVRRTLSYAHPGGGADIVHVLRAPGGVQKANEEAPPYDTAS